MRWQEVVHIIASPTRRPQIIEILKQACTDLIQLAGLEEAGIVCHKILENEIVLTLTWQQDTQAVKSKACLALAQYLESFGMVSHSIWIHQLRHKGKAHEAH